ncbi:MAG: TrpR-related protein YerC/YecD [Clostridia bacterium]|nr:TrpR-related protein YerC/YecD [Clostridia bacterium]
MSQITKQQKIQALYEFIASLDNAEDCRALFEDMCTIKEIDNMAERCHAAKLLMQGDTYAQVMEKANISSATLSRVSRCVQYGKGYSRLLQSNVPPVPDK